MAASNFAFQTLGKFSDGTGTDLAEFLSSFDRLPWLVKWMGTPQLRDNG